MHMQLNFCVALTLSFTTVTSAEEHLGNLHENARGNYVACLR